MGADGRPQIFGTGTHPGTHPPSACPVLVGAQLSPTPHAEGSSDAAMVDRPYRHDHSTWNEVLVGLGRPSEVPAHFLGQVPVSVGGSEIVSAEGRPRYCLQSLGDVS
jgi:hypothetical protein